MEHFDLANLPPEVLEQLIAMGAIGGEQDELAQQMEQAQAIRTQGMPEGRYTGRTYVAANPLEFIGDFMQKRNAKKEMGGIRDSQEELRQQQLEGRRAFLEMLRNPPQPQPPAMQGPPGPPPQGPVGPPAPGPQAPPIQQGPPRY